MSIIEKAVSIAAGLLFCSGALADDGYRLDYDYPGQGDDWYGGTAAPDARRDYPPNDVDSAYDGDDYGVGYDRRFDPHGFGPHLELTNSRHTAHEFRFGHTIFPAPDCLDNGDCGSGSFCRSADTCNVGHCGGGSPRNCSDGDPCTIDTCSNALQQCLHDPKPPIGETSGLTLSRGAGSDVATLSWSDRPDELHYHVYRGEDPALGDLTCFDSEVFGTSLDDDGTLAVSGLYVHLVSAVDQCGEGTLGDDSSGVPRPNTAPCP